MLSLLYYLKKKKKVLPDLSSVACLRIIRGKGDF